jgi:signal transduction histidine kinase
MSGSAVRLYLPDVALALGLAAASPLAGDDLPQAKLQAIFGGAAGLRHATTVWWLFTALLVAGVTIRRRWPLVALAIVGVGAAVHQLDRRFDLRPVDFAVPIVLYAVASLARRRWHAGVALAVTLVGAYLVTLGALIGARAPAGKLAAPLAGTPPLGVLSGAFSASMQELLVLMLAFAIGDGVRSRRGHVRSLEQRAADLEREQHQRTALAGAAERARLTRELHDVVAHGLTVMVVQAQGAAAAIERRPDRAAAALQQVIGVGRASLAEMRRLLGLVRRDQPTNHLALTPQPSITALPALIDQVRATGTRVRLHVDGQPVPLPATVELSVYRIVQEALTNTIKHAHGDARADVRLSFEAGHLEVEVTDDGAGAAPTATADGHGLRGVAERVSLLGGRLTVGPLSAGGFRVHAVLPIEEGA